MLDDIMNSSFFPTPKKTEKYPLSASPRLDLSLEMNDRRTAQDFPSLSENQSFGVSFKMESPAHNRLDWNKENSPNNMSFPSHKPSPFGSDPKNNSAQKVRLRLKENTAINYYNSMMMKSGTSASN